MQELLRLQAQQKGSAVNDPVFKQGQEENTKVIKESVDTAKKELNQTQSLIDAIKDLRDSIKQNLKMSISAGGIGNVQAVGKNATAEKTLKQVLFGNDSKEDVENKSWTKKLGFSKSPTMALYDWADKRDQKKQRIEPSEEQTEERVANENASKALLSAQTTIGSTATESLKVQREQLEILKQILKIAEEGGGSGGEGGGFGLGDVADLMGGRGGKPSGPTGKPAGKPGIGSKAMNFLKGTGGKLLGAVGALGFGAYTAYEGVSNANQKEALRNQEIDAAVERGEINEKQAQELKKQISDETDVNRGEAVGEGTGMAAGGIAGAAGGAAVGGAIGSAFFGVGAVPGALIGGAIGGIGGAIAGSTLGKKAGGAIVEGYQGVKNFFGSKKEQLEQSQLVQAWNDRDKGLDAGVGVRQGEQMITAENNLERKTTSDGSIESKFNKGITNEKTAMGSGFLARLLAPKGTQTEKFLADTSDTKGDKTNHSGFMGTRKEGGLFSKDEYTLIDTNTYDQFKVEKDTFMKAKEIAAKGGDASEIYKLLREDPLVQKQRETEGIAAAEKLGASPENMQAVTESQANNADDIIRPEDTQLTRDPVRINGVDVRDMAPDEAIPTMQLAPAESPIVAASKNNEEIRSDVGGAGSTIINAPNNSVNNSGGGQPDSSAMRSPIRNPESSVARYIDSKYAV